MADFVWDGSLRVLVLVDRRNWIDSRRDNLPNLDQARQKQKLCWMIASQKRRRCPGISPSGSTWLVPDIRMCNSHHRSVLLISFSLFVSPLHPSNVLLPARWKGNGKPTWNLPSKIFHNFLLCTLLGYSIFRFPLLATICSAVNGLLVYLHLSSAHHCLTAATSSRNCCSSPSGSTAGLFILLAMVMGIHGT